MALPRFYNIAIRRRSNIHYNEAGFRWSSKLLTSVAAAKSAAVGTIQCRFPNARSDSVAPERVLGITMIVFDWSSTLLNRAKLRDGVLARSSSGIRRGLIL